MSWLEFDVFYIIKLFIIIIIISALIIILSVQFLLNKKFKNKLSKTINEAPLQKMNLLKELEKVILSFDENDPSADLKLRDELKLVEYCAVANLLEALKENMPPKPLGFLNKERDIQLIKSCFWYIENHKELLAR